MTKQRVYDDATLVVYTPENMPKHTAQTESSKPETKHPNHYNRGIECWDYIVSHLSLIHI